MALLINLDIEPFITFNLSLRVLLLLPNSSLLVLNSMAIKINAMMMRITPIPIALTA